MKKIRVLIVDDSIFFRKRLAEILQADRTIEIVAEACNGREAVELAEKHLPDVITMDIEMPDMDGITAVKEIMKRKRIPILMLSSFSTAGARATLTALDAGAVDYMSKNIKDIHNNYDAVVKDICNRVRQVAKSKLSKINDSQHIGLEQTSNSTNSEIGINLLSHKLIVVGASTGGPPAIQQIIEKLPANYCRPLIVIQHMPESFTGPFAERLNSVANVRVKLAEDNEILVDGTVYIAPGGHQLTVMSHMNSSLMISVKRASLEETYKPCIDTTLESIADKVNGKSLVVILTGMGKDGTDGARIIKDKEATIIAQDKSTSVVYGMPMMLSKSGLVDYELPLFKIVDVLAGI